MFFEDEVFDITTDGACPVDRPIESAEEQEVGANLRMDMHPFKEVADWNDATLQQILLYIYIYLYILKNIHIYYRRPFGVTAAHQLGRKAAVKQQKGSRKATERRQKGTSLIMTNT